ncbi:MAG: S8 family serine peptidase [Nannocystales bacterium]
MHISTRLSLFTLCTLVVPSACDAGDNVPGEDANEEGDTRLRAASVCSDPSSFGPPDIATACDGRRIVALIGPPKPPPASSADEKNPKPTLSAPPCPGGTQISTSTGVWRVSPVFAGNVPVLNRYCLYEWASTQPKFKEAPQYDALPTDVLAMQPDCDWVFPQNNALADPTAATLTNTFRKHAGRMSDPDAHLNQPGHRVTVAVLDTARIAGAEARSPHGEAMADLIADLACGDQGPNCPRTVTTELALPRYYNNVGLPTTDTWGGGHFGGQVDLARAIDNTVNDWLLSRGSDDAQRLVLNLSVGWDAHFGDIGVGGGASSHINTLLNPASQVDIPVRTQAVHAALVRASCEGALIIVSAGNQPVGGCEYGALNPGAWERLSAPTAAQCDDLGFSPTPHADGWSTQPPASLGYTPLVHAVGAIGHDELPIAMTREGSMPRIAAPGYHASAEIDQPSAVNETFTGTSVSAAVASAAAATVWSQHPGLSAAEVMALVHAGGVDLATPQQSAVNLTGQPSTSVHRISLCGTVKSACEALNAPESCTAIECADTEVDTSDTQLVVDSYAGVATPLSVELDANTHVCFDACGKAVETTVPILGMLTDDLPQPWTNPQPEYPFCDVCQIDDDKFTASLNAAYDKTNITVNNVSLTVYYQGYSAPSVFNLGALPLDSSTIHTVANPSFAASSGGVPKTAVRAVVSASMTCDYGSSDRKFTVSNAILVAP